MKRALVAAVLLAVAAGVALVGGGDRAGIAPPGARVLTPAPGAPAPSAAQESGLFEDEAAPAPPRAAPQPPAAARPPERRAVQRPLAAAGTALPTEASRHHAGQPGAAAAQPGGAAAAGPGTPGDAPEGSGSPAGATAAAPAPSAPASPVPASPAPTPPQPAPASSAAPVITPPVPLLMVPPRHPEAWRVVAETPGLTAEARPEAVTARVRLRLLVRDDGSVGRVEIAVPSGRPELDAAAAAAAAAWRFHPARRDGTPIASVVLIWVAFVLGP